MAYGFGEGVGGYGGRFVVVVRLVSFGEDGKVVSHLHPSDPVRAHQRDPRAQQHMEEEHAEGAPLEDAGARGPLFPVALCKLEPKFHLGLEVLEHVEDIWGDSFGSGGRHGGWSCL